MPRQYRRDTLAKAGPGPARELTLVPAPARTLSTVLVCAGIAALFLYLSRHGDTDAQAATLLVWAVGLAYAARLHPGVTYLKLTPTGMEYKNYLPARFIKWELVRRFTTYRSKWGSYVGWTYAERFSNHSAASRLGRMVKGIDDGLSENFGYPAEELANLLETWRQRTSCD